MPDKDKHKSLRDAGVKMLFGEIEQESVEDVIEFILEENFSKQHEELTLIINSEGGSCSDGFALIDVMSGSKIPVHTVGIGLLASMGLLIFMAGAKGKRTLTPNTMVMSHQWWSGVFGKEHELFAVVKHHQLLKEKIIKHYKKYTGLTEDAIKEELLPAHDVWLSAKDCKNLGVCDIVKDI